MKKKNLIIGASALVVVILVLLFYFRNKQAGAAEALMATVKRGPFKVEIETTGELEAKNSVKILGPTQLRDFRIWNVTIQNIIDEGTVVKKGEWVATLDRSEFQNRFNEKQIELEKANSKFVQTQLDTTLQMRQSRDELINLKYGYEEKKIILDQSKFEPPATIKQNEINLEKAVRAYEQAQENYKIKKKQNVEKMREVSAELKKVQNEFGAMMKVMEAFNVTAPEDGMVIYEKGWDGKPIKAGSQINMWEPTVATLPDLTKMMSKTYVNEVDVRKVKAGQSVDIGLDAYPDKKLSGKVIRVANVGEQRPNSDAKVFEVAVEIAGTDPTLRPSMTTSNRIVAHVIDSALYIPLESLHSQADTVTFVYKVEGLKTVKQEVMIGHTNANDVVILGGLTLEDKVYLSVPAGLEEEEVALLKEMNGKRKKEDQQEKPAETEQKKVVPTASVQN
ncbi:efflux RND transporter periplasmic adaptor subunit [Pseudochryseolinea flava]|uniref:RND transporter n=1 Tax=Pseudochryseolinea flava TaxID=2059302 RepID=A0A364XZG3_9BACT|nr:HlyD family efflux transporter periplasmic adaptor subunit [Pseudochryseolinea flava]RAV98831.1 RND transporter [Pseudochryseolinea flava]